MVIVSVENRLQVASTPRVLIGTLYSGENEFSEVRTALARQTFTNWEHVVVEHLENKEAHDTLYRYFMNRRNEFDLFLKLDGDMVFRTTESLGELVRLFQSVPDLDHLMTPVFDWYSRMHIPALHMFSNRAAWIEDAAEQLFVDAPPQVPGKRISWRSHPAPFVVHSPNPSPEQAFLFGVHRASKVIQSGRRVFHRGQASFQWRLLKAVWKHYEETRDPRLGLCLHGAELVFRGRLTHSDYVTGKTREAALQDFHINDAYPALREHWGSTIRRELRYHKLTARRYLHSLFVQPPTLRGVLKRLGVSD